MTLRHLLIALAAATLLALAVWTWFGSTGEGKDGRGDRGQQPVLVTLSKVERRAFVDVIEAVGSARANESSKESFRRSARAGYVRLSSRSSGRRDCRR